MTENKSELQYVSQAKLKALRTNLEQAVLGCERQIELLLVALLARGHVLIQGAPGTGKTSLAKTMAASIDCVFKRIQFTPDLLPADILGYSIYDEGASEFRFHPGPVFTSILLADEINRTTPRVQSALLEAMNEGQVSIDGRTRKLEPPFFVIATQNQLYTTGTFPLPESQLDRFLLSFEMPRPDPDTQTAILNLHLDGEPSEAARPVVEKQELLRLQGELEHVTISEDLMRYISALAEATHGAEAFVTGASARAALALMRTAQAAAYLDGRQAVYPDDIKQMLPHVLAHRLTLRNRSRKAGGSVRHYLDGILGSVPVP